MYNTQKFRWSIHHSQKALSTLLAVVLLLGSVHPLMADALTDGQNEVPNDIAHDAMSDVKAQNDDEKSPQISAGVEAEIRFMHIDGTGNIIAMTDATGEQVWRSQIDPFGRGIEREGDEPYYFLEQPIEVEIGDMGGLYMLGARFYDPISGRFMSIDPEPMELIPTSAPQKFNRYAYAVNNPLRYSDPSGLTPTSVSPLRVPPTSLDVWVSRIDNLIDSPQLGPVASQMLRMVRREGLDVTVNFLKQAETIRNGQRVLHIKDVQSLLTSNKVGGLLKSSKTYREVTQVVKRPSRAPGTSVSASSAGKLSKLQRVGKVAKFLGVIGIAYGTIELVDGNYAQAAEQYATAIPGVGDAVMAAEEMGFGTSQEIFETATTFWGDLAYELINDEE